MKESMLLRCLNFKYGRESHSLIFLLLSRSLTVLLQTQGTWSFWFAYGTEEQKARWLVPLLRERLASCFAD